MSTSQFFMPSNNILGQGALAEGFKPNRTIGFKKAVTDAPLVQMGMAQQVADRLAEKGIEYVIFDGVKTESDRRQCQRRFGTTEQSAGRLHHLIGRWLRA